MVYSTPSKILVTVGLVGGLGGLGGVGGVGGLGGGVGVGGHGGQTGGAPVTGINNTWPTKSISGFERLFASIRAATVV